MLCGMDVIGMESCAKQLIQDLKGAFVYSSGFIKRDSNEIRQRIQQQRALTNCKRILALMPVFIIMDIYALVKFVMWLKFQAGGMAATEETVFAMRLLTGTAFALLLVLLVIGLVAQCFEVEMWTLREYIYSMTFVDALTNLLNRRGGNAVMELELEKRGGRAELGVIMLDIDFFKKYNDSLGHDSGDDCLKEVSASIREAIGERTKIMIRHGGEEFVIILFDCTLEETERWAEKIRQTVYNKQIPAPYQEVADVVTVSVGAAGMVAEAGMHYEDMLKAADLSLYMAKELGRNQVVCR